MDDGKLPRHFELLRRNNTITVRQYKKVKCRKMEQKCYNEWGTVAEAPSYSLTYKNNTFSDQSLTDGKMNLVSFSKYQPNAQSGIDTNGCTVTNEKVTATEVACDGGCFLLCQCPRSLGGSES